MYPKSLRLIRHLVTTVSRSGLILGGWPKSSFWDDNKHIFPGSAQKCFESIVFYQKFANPGWVAKIKFLGPKSGFSQDRPKSGQNR